MKLTRAYLLLLTVFTGFLCGCATTSTSSSHGTPDPNVLRVGLAADVPPLAFRAGSDYRGLEPDLARALGSSLGKRVEFVEVRWDKLIDALLSDKIDIIMSGMTITPARSMRVNFTKPYLRSGQTLLARRTDAAVIPASLFEPKTRVGAQEATTGDFWVKQNCSKNVRKEYRTAALGAKALVAHQIDAFICDAPVNWWLASENEATGLTVVGGYLTQEYLGWAVRKDDTALLTAANHFIDEGRTSGKLEAIIRNWIPYQ